MANAFANRMRSPGDPAVTAFDITPNDTTDLPQATAAVNVATPGTVRATMLDGSISDLSVNAGAAFPIQATRIWQTGTTATGIKGLV